MRSLKVMLCALGALAGPVQEGLAQGPFPPCCVPSPFRDGALGPAAFGFPGGEVRDLSLLPDPGLPGGYLALATVLPVGGGSAQLAYGSWTPGGGLVPNSALVGALNLAGLHSESASLSGDGLRLVFQQRGPLGVVLRISSRPALSAAFGAPIDLLPAPVSSYDPTIGRDGTGDVVFWCDASSGSIQFRQLLGTRLVGSVGTAAVMSAPFLPARPSALDTESSPIAAAQTRGLLFLRRDPASGVDQLFMDPVPFSSLPTEQVGPVDTLFLPAGSLGSVASVSGTLYVPAAPFSANPFRIDTFLLASERVGPSGGVAAITLFTPARAANPVYFLFASPGFATTPICLRPPCPSPWEIFLDLSPVFALGGVPDLNPGQSDVFSWTFPVPPAPPGSVALQVVGLPAPGWLWATSNGAVL